MNTLTRIASAVMLAGLLAPAVILFSVGPAHAQAQRVEQTQTAQVPYSLAYTSRLTVRADRTATQVFAKRYKVLVPNAVQPLSQQRLTYTEGAERLEILEAFTEKPDGRRIPVDPASIITRDAGSGPVVTYQHGLKERIIIFPNVEVGDIVVMTIKLETLRGPFAGQFTYADTFPRSALLTSARIVVEAPKSLDLHVKTLGAALSDQIEETGGIRRHTVTLTPSAPAPEEPGAVAPIDREPSILVSTFKSYQELGLAYRASALPKAEVTPEIAALADEITRGIEGKQAQAAAIDAWVKKNIRYVAAYASLNGGFVPHDAMAVLRNRWGDCKDHATVMSALLAAKGISSEQALISAGNAYTLPEPPTMAVLNHVILYMPELDFYADPTDTHAAFGVLSPQTYDKPVVRVSASGVTLARTPPMRTDDHAYHARTVINIAADGTVTGRTEEKGRGWFGSFRRSRHPARVASRSIIHRRPPTR